MDPAPIRVFLSDDHPIVRRGLVCLLGRDARFCVVGDSGEGLDTVRQVTDLKPDVLVLDISMPGLNGLDVCREVRRKAPNTAVLVLSMHDNEQIVLRALEQGASGYLMKGTSTRHLREALGVVAGGGTYLGPGLPPDLLHRRVPGRKDPYDRLTSRERQVIQLIAQGLALQEIANRLGMAPKTVNTHRYNLMRKLGIHSQTALVRFVYERRLTVGVPSTPLSQADTVEHLDEDLSGSHVECAE